MDNLEKVKRHLAKPVPVVLKNLVGEEDTFFFRPLNIEQQAILMEVSRRIETRQKIKVGDKDVPDLKKEDMKEMVDLLTDIVKCSIEGLDEITLNDFVNTNFEQLSEKMLDLIPASTSKKDIELIKKRQEEMKNARQDSGNKE